MFGKYFGNPEAKTRTRSAASSYVRGDTIELRVEHHKNRTKKGMPAFFSLSVIFISRVVTFYLNGEEATPYLTSIAEGESLYPMVYNMEYALCSIEYSLL
jgi:hypothetical protein